MKYNEIHAYDRTKDPTIEMCLNCTKKKCSGMCNLKNKKQSNNRNKRTHNV